MLNLITQYRKRNRSFLKARRARCSMLTLALIRIQHLQIPSQVDQQLVLVSDQKRSMKSSALSKHIQQGLVKVHSQQSFSTKPDNTSKTSATSMEQHRED